MSVLVLMAAMGWASAPPQKVDEEGVPWPSRKPRGLLDRLKWKGPLSDRLDPLGREIEEAERALAWKGALLQRQLQRRLYLSLAADPETKAAAERLQAATRRLAALRLSPKATKSKLAELEKEQDAAQAELSRLSAAFRAERDRERPSPETLAKALPEGAMLVDFLHFHGRGAPVGKDGKRQWERRLVAFVHRRGRPAARVSLGRAAPVERAVREWLPLLRSGKPGGMPAAVLQRLIWLPLEKHLEGAKTIVISPDGVLSLVPFAALPGKKKGTYLIENVAVALVPAPSAIPEMMKPIPAKGRAKPSLLAVGGVDFGKGGKWAALPDTAGEVEKAAAIFRGAHGAFTDNILSGGRARKRAVVAALERVRYAHLATHGWFAPEELKKAGDGSGKDDVPTGWHPLLLSGLALADANRGPKEGEEDGILTALEVAEMDLLKLELVVLSADEMASGVIAGGEGLLGMQRAFQAAGCRSVVAALWKIDREATRVLMERFYQHLWAKKLPKAEALRQAQLDIIRDPTLVDKKAKTAPPAWWAAWQISGDWR
jgi:CHAT domain-containing protein